METPIVDEMKLSNKEYNALNAQAVNYRVILRFLKIGGFDSFLAGKNLPPIDILLTPDDTTGGESATLFLKEIADECNRMDQRITKLSEALVDANILISTQKREVVEEGKSILQKIKEFIFIS